MVVVWVIWTNHDLMMRLVKRGEYSPKRGRQCGFHSHNRVGFDRFRGIAPDRARSSARLAHMRCFIFWVILGALLGSAAAERPNILLIVVDDMGWGDVSCFGGQGAYPKHGSASRGRTALMAAEPKIRWFFRAFDSHSPL